MDKIDFAISVASSLFEILAISTFLYEKEKSCKKYNVRFLMLILSTLFLTVVLNEVLETKFSGVIYIYFVIMYSFLLNYNFFKSLIKFIGGSLVIMALQLIILYIIESIYVVDAVDDHSFYFFIALSTVLSAALIKKLFYKLVRKFNVFLDSIDDKVLRYLVINVTTYIFLYKVIWEYDYEVISNNLLIFTGIFLVVSVLSVLLFKNTADLIENSKAHEVQKSLSLTIRDMINDMRARQHEYKNHINTILGIIEVSDEKVLKNRVKDYISELNNSEAKELDLVFTDNDILKAVIYVKLNEAIQKNIKFVHKLRSSLTDTKIMNYELAEILNNLINNAFEAALDSDEPYVEFEIFREDNLNAVVVKNNGKKIRPSEFSEYLAKGVSSKGDGRGYGLYNVNKILQKYNGKLELYVENELTTIKLIFN